jgi:hypothetical protein
MGKRGSSTTSTAAGTAKRVKRNTKAIDSDAPNVGNWSQTKFLEQDLQKTTKTGILKVDPAEIRIGGPEIIPGHPRDSGYSFSPSSSVVFLSFARIPLRTPFRIWNSAP